MGASVCLHTVTRPASDDTQVRSLASRSLSNAPKSGTRGHSVYLISAILVMGEGLLEALDVVDICHS
jgi:hypothetical protein